MDRCIMEVARPALIGSTVALSCLPIVKLSAMSVRVTAKTSEMLLRPPTKPPLGTILWRSHVCVCVCLHFLVLCCRWGKRAAHNRAQICYYIAENLMARGVEFAQRITSQTGRSEEVGIVLMVMV